MLIKLTSGRGTFSDNLVAPTVAAREEAKLLVARLIAKSLIYKSKRKYREDNNDIFLKTRQK